MALILTSRFSTLSVLLSKHLMMVLLLHQRRHVAERVRHIRIRIRPVTHSLPFHFALPFPDEVFFHSLLQCSITFVQTLVAMWPGILVLKDLCNTTALSLTFCNQLQQVSLLESNLCFPSHVLIIASSLRLFPNYLLPERHALCVT